MGDRAQITLPGNRTTPGTVDPARDGRELVRIRVGPRAGSGSSSRDHPGLHQPRRIPGRPRGLDQAPVQVEITTAGVENALSVPVTALVGRSGGGFAVEVVRAGGRRELVAVKLGLFDTAAGRVQVEGDLRAGDHVVVPSL